MTNGNVSEFIDKITFQEEAVIYNEDGTILLDI